MTNAHHAILDYASRHKLKDTPRTTCVACIVQDNVAYWAHAGDSRLYLIRDGRLVAQTKDHSRIRLLIEEGMITEAQAPFTPIATRSTVAWAVRRPRKSNFRARRRWITATSYC
jgi:serine/threonine protein phosphatase PrpC